MNGSALATRATPAAAAPADPRVEIPASHEDLLDRAICGVITTLGRDGHPRSSLVWVDRDDECARVNTTLERAKGRDMRADPRVSLLIVDPGDTTRSIQIRGDVELSTVGADAHVDALTRKYTPHPAFYGHVRPLEARVQDTRVIARIRARRITLDAIHTPGRREA